MSTLILRFQTAVYNCCSPTHVLDLLSFTRYHYHCFCCSFTKEYDGPKKLSMTSPVSSTEISIAQILSVMNYYFWSEFACILCQVDLPS